MLKPSPTQQQPLPKPQPLKNPPTLTPTRPQSLPPSHHNSQTSYNFHRNNKSLKILNIHLKQYRSSQSQTDRERQGEGKRGYGNGYSSGIGFGSGVGSGAGTALNEEMKESKDGEKERGNGDREFVAKCQALIDQLLLNLGIFKKVFAKSKKKRSILQKLYGWDPMFKPVFFVAYGQTYSQQLKPKLSKQSILSQLSLQKKSFTNKNIYNKLRFFLTQLITTNLSYQQTESIQQKQKLIESSIKLRESIEKISNDSSGKRNTMKYVEIMKQTQNDMANMKMRIKNKAAEIQRLVMNTGSVRVNPFYLKEEKNVHNIQSYVRNSIKKV